MERILKTDESCISNPEVRKWEVDCPSNLILQISGFEMQDSSDFEILSTPPK
jgi:hypothetical protein